MNKSRYTTMVLRSMARLIGDPNYAAFVTAVSERTGYPVYVVQAMIEKMASGA